MTGPAVGGDGTVLVDALAGAIEVARQGRDLEPVTVVTPSVHSSFYLRRALGIHGLFNVRFSRLDDLAEELAGTEGRRPPLTRLLAHELVRAAALDESVKLPPELLHARRHPAFHAALHRTLDDLETVPDDRISRLEKVDPIRAGLVRLRARYREMASTYEGRTAVADRAIKTLNTDPARVASALGRVVIVTAGTPPPEYAALQRAMSGLSGAKQVPGTSRNHDASTKLKLISVSDPSSEADWIVRNTIQLASNLNLRFSDIAVFYQDESYGTRLDEAFRLAGVPVSGPDPNPIANMPEGRFVLGALATLAPEHEKDLLRRDSTMGWLTGSPVAPAAKGGSSHPARWDAISRSAGIIGGAEDWRRRLTEYAERIERRATAGLSRGEADEAEANGLRAQASEARKLQRLVDDLAATAAPRAPGSWDQLSQWLRGVIDGYLERTDDPESTRRREMLADLLDRIEELDAAVAGAPTLERFRAIVEQELHRAFAPARPLNRGVFVAHIRHAPGTRFSAVHVAGMIDGHYPSPAKQDPLLPDSIRGLIDRDGAWLERSEHIRARDAVSYMAAVHAAPQAFLSWPRVEAGAVRPAIPSRWLVEAARHASRNDQMQASDLTTPTDPGDRPWLEFIGGSAGGIAGMPADACASRHEYDLRSIADWRSAGRDVAGHWLSSADGRRLARAIDLERARSGTMWSEFDGAVRVPGASISIPGNSISPTRLEAWARCPFRYFLGYVLRLAALPNPEEAFTISALDRGDLVHRILSLYFQVRSRGGDGGQGEARNLAGRLVSMREVANECLDAAPQRYMIGKRVLWDLERERIERDLTEFVELEESRERESGLAQEAAELEFGRTGAQVGSVFVRLDNGRVVNFHGAIDRVERSADGRRVAVIDYKSGSADPYRSLDLDPVDRGMRLQLPIYAEAVRQKYPAAEEVTARYWFVTRRSGFQVRPRGPVDARERMLGAVATIVAGIERGVFVARPGPRTEAGYENCRFCDFDRVCPTARDRVWERKRNDAGLTGYRMLAEPESAAQRGDDSAQPGDEGK